VPGENETNKASSLANSVGQAKAPVNSTASIKDKDGDSKLGISSGIKVSTAEVKDVKKDEKKEEPKKEETKEIISTAPAQTPTESKDFTESLVKGLSTVPDSGRKALVQ